ncbi:MAG: MFS transporter [Eubacterium sp.]|nr:MFS transporter [Eubacterium sp.]
MEQTQKKSIGFGFFGWMLLIFQAGAFFTQVVFTNYPMNILAEFYGGGTFVPMIFTIGTFIAIILQLILSRFVGKIKNMKNLTLIFGAISLLMGCVIAFYPVPFGISAVWVAAYFVESVCVNMYCTFTCSILVGQWFPRRKGTIMGIATLLFPIGNGLISIFAANVFKTGAPTPASAFLPFLIACIITWVIGLIFVKDYPEQCGAYRDNDKSFTPEIARKMMEEEIENKKSTVWTTGHTFMSRDFWFISVTCGLLLMFAVGMMTQTATIVAQFETLNYGMVMMLIMIFGIVGSYGLGIIDTKIGTKKAIAIAVIMMILSGIFGTIQHPACLIIALILLAMFMGASSNFTVSAAAQYWRREDFSSVFACLNPVANIFNAITPSVIAFLLFSSPIGYRMCFIVTAIAGVVGLILILLFSAKHVKATDDKFRSQAGKPLDDALVGRK